MTTSASPARAGIVIRTLNEEAMLERTLASTATQRRKPLETIVVDSGSTDGTLDIARRYDTRIISIPRGDFTYGKALNVGIDALGPDVDAAVLLSAHAVPAEDRWLESLLLPLEDSRVAGVYGRQVPLPEHLSDSVVRALAADSYPRRYGMEGYVSAEVAFFSNANSAVSMAWWRKLRFDEAAPYSEDQLWARQMLSMGALLAYEPRAAVYHSHAEGYRGYFRRCVAEARAERLLDAGTARKPSAAHLARSVASSVRAYVRAGTRTGSWRGAAWDRVRADVVRSAARYRGARNDR